MRRSKNELLNGRNNPQEFALYAAVCTFNTNYHVSLLRSTGQQEETAAFFINNELSDSGGFNDVIEGEIYPVIRIVQSAD